MRTSRDCHWTTPSWAAVLVAAFVILAVGIGARSLLAGESPMSAIGRVTQHEGQVHVLRNDKTIALAPGALVYERDLVVTADSGRLKIEFLDGSLLAVGGATRIFVADYALSGSDRRLGAMFSLLSGIVRAVVAGPGGHFDIGSRAAVASARSTEWLMEAGPDGTAVFAAVGSVEVQAVSSNLRVLLRQGEGTDVPASGAPTQPKVWGQARVDAFLARTSLGDE